MKYCYFVSLTFKSSKFQKQFMTKSKTHLGFKSLANHKYIKRKINSNKYKSQKDKKDVSPSLTCINMTSQARNIQKPFFRYP